jgi:predicted RNA binding protein YcfA (HicA-like mRNA interferase family)
MSGKDFLKILEREGWVAVRVNRSHYILKRSGRTIILPLHGNSDLKTGLLNSILKKAGLK